MGLGVWVLGCCCLYVIFNQLFLWFGFRDFYGVVFGSVSASGSDGETVDVEGKRIEV